MVSNLVGTTLAALAVCLMAAPAHGQYANSLTSSGYPYPAGVPAAPNSYIPQNSTYSRVPQPAANVFPTSAAVVYPGPRRSTWQPPAAGAPLDNASWNNTSWNDEPWANTSWNGGPAPSEVPTTGPQHYGTPPAPVSNHAEAEYGVLAGSSPATALLGPDCVSCAHGGAGHGCFVNYDGLRWTITPPKSTLIGNTALEGLYTRGGVTTLVQNSLNTSFLDYDWSGGHRFEVGHMDCDRGWMVGYAFGEQEQGLTSTSVTFLPGDPGITNPTLSYFTGYFDGNGDGIDDDINLNNFFGRFGEDIGTPNGAGGFVPPFDGTPDVPAPPDTGDLQIYLPVFTEVTVRHRLRLDNVELMYISRQYNQPAGSFEWISGFRYLTLEDYFGFEGVGGVLDTTSFAATTENQLLGLQIGARWRYCHRNWTLNAEGRFLAAGNMQDTKLQGVLASNGTTNNTGQNSPLRLDPQAFNYSQGNNEWAPLGEVRLQAICAISPCLALRLGYTGFVAGGISRASQKVQYVMPRFGLSNAGSNETIVFNSFTVGLELKR